MDFKESEKLIDSFSRPISANISNVPGNIQTELTELQCDSELKEKFKLGLTDFYSKYFDKDNFLNIRLNSLKMMSHFRSTYVCEQLFLKMNFVKNKTRSRLKNYHLENSIKVSTSKIRPDIDNLVNKIQQQTSHLVFLTIIVSLNLIKNLHCTYSTTHYHFILKCKI